MKKIEIEIPEGKRAELVNNVMTLVEEQPKSIIDRVETIHDACNILGEDHWLVRAYGYVYNKLETIGIDALSYMQLRIVVEALNEGWVAAENINDQWWFPWFYRFDKCTESKYNGFISAKSYSDSGVNRGVAFAYPDHDLSRMYSFYGSHLALKSSELAEYCGKQFIQLWAGYLIG